MATYIHPRVALADLVAPPSAAAPVDVTPAALAHAAALAHLSLPGAPGEPSFEALRKDVTAVLSAAAVLKDAARSAAAGAAEEGLPAGRLRPDAVTEGGADAGAALLQRAAVVEGRYYSVPRAVEDAPAEEQD